ncbi:MAG TPA: glycosyltransferase [Bacteroidia bacterium]|nr:glycosyltransferase [Bacteroidia bacterium]
MIYFLIPVFNEADNIPLLAESVINILPSEDKHYIFVDDCSTDNTIEVIKKYFAGKLLQVITKEINGGPGDSFNKGFEWILQTSSSDADIVVTMEGDNTSDIKILPTMTTLSGLGYDLVLASVYAQGGGFNKTSFFRRLISVVANTAIRFIFDLKVLTLSSFYRVYSVDLLRKIKKEHPVLIQEKGFISMVELLLKAIRAGAKIIEVPMLLDMTKRKGKSKMKTFKTTFSYLKFLINDLSRKR